MGLPLFVAPVESDVKPTTEKRTNPASTSRVTGRSTLRNVARERERQSRALRRRVAILRENFPTPGPSSRPWADGSYPPPSDQPARYPWIESGQPPPPEAYNPLPGRSATQGPERSASNRSRWTRVNNINQDRLLSLLGDTYFLGSPSYSQSPSPPAEEDSSRPSRPLSRHGRYEHDEEQDGPEDENGHDTYERERIARSVAARFDRSPDRSLRRRVGRATENMMSRRRRQVSGRTPAGISSTTRPSATDGLGDRNRSLSPEVWDTLLTTLTPDPQPPSAGSSFASASASAATSQNQSAAVSSRTSLAGPGMEDDALEPPCESGRENSDSDYDPTDDDSSLRPDHLARNVPSRHRRFVTALDSNGYANTSYVRAEDALYRHIPGLFGAQDHPAASIGALRRNRLSRSARAESLLSRFRAAVEDGARMSQAAEETPALEQSFTSRETESAGNSQTTDDVDWVGMQRIVRNLAERQDIPDEWWAEAGLSRTIPDDS